MNDRPTRRRAEHGVSRRGFLKLGAAGTLGALAPFRLPAADDTLNRRPIPASGQRIPVIGLGTWQTFDVETHLATLKRWRDEGRVRYIGVTHYTDSSHDDLARIVAREPIDFVQFNYNIRARHAERRLLPAAADNGVATLINEPFESGSLFARVRGASLPEWAREELGVETWAPYFLEFIAGHPAVTCTIPATSDPEHAADNIGAAHGPLPDATMRERMARHFAGL